MKTVLGWLHTWIVKNWKTTALGVIAAIELYQHTGDLKAAATAFLFGLFSSDGKVAAPSA